MRTFQKPFILIIVLTLSLLGITCGTSIRESAQSRDLAVAVPGTGFGLDFAVILDPVEANTISKGEYYWSGAAGTWFWIDPVEDLIFVGMIQQFGAGRPDVRSLTRQLTYQAIIESKNSN